MRDDEGIAARLAEVVERHSQAEVARRLGTSRSNVSRYLKGRRVSASFCAGLVSAFEVDPRWLLTGEGQMFSADVAAGTEQLAGDLLEMVTAMEAVGRMRLGAVAASPARRALRELDRALTRHERLGADLDERSRPVLGELLAEARECLINADDIRSRAALEAAERVARFCHDPAMRRELDSYRGVEAARRGDVEAASAFHRRAFAGCLLADSADRDELSKHAFNHANLLHRRGRLTEARRACEAALALLRPEEGEAWPVGERLLLLKRGSLDVDLGDLRRMLGESLPAFGALPATNQDQVRGACVGALLLAGTLAPGELAPLPTTALTHLYAARWAESPERARAALAIARWTSPALEATSAAWLAAHEGRHDEAAARLAAPAPTSLEDLERRVVAVDAARLAGASTRRQRAALARADKAAAALGAGTQPSIWTRALHEREALWVGAPARVEQARAVFADLAERGYALLRPQPPA